MSRLLGLGERFLEFSQACVSAEPGSEFRIVDSHDLEGTWSAIFFWPADFTFVCPTELVEFNRALREFRALAARVFGVSADSHDAHLAWRQENPALRNPEFPMLADFRKELPESSGFWIRSRRSRFATYLVDPERKIRWLCVNDLSVGRSTGEVLRYSRRSSVGSCARPTGAQGKRRSSGRQTSEACGVGNQRKPCRPFAFGDAGVSIDVQFLQKCERITDALEQILVVLDHLATHAHAKPLLVSVKLIRSNTSFTGASACSRSLARNIAHSKPSEIDWKYGEPIAESPTRNTDERANGWSPVSARRHCRLVALRARYKSSGIRTISRSPTNSPLVSCLTLAMKRSIDWAT